MDATYGAYVAAEKNTCKNTNSNSNIKAINSNNKANYSNNTHNHISNNGNDNNKAPVPVHTGSGSYRFGF